MFFCLLLNALVNFMWVVLHFVGRVHRQVIHKARLEPMVLFHRHTADAEAALSGATTHRPCIRGLFEVLLIKSPLVSEIGVS